MDTTIRQTGTDNDPIDDDAIGDTGDTIEDSTDSDIDDGADSEDDDDLESVS